MVLHNVNLKFSQNQNLNLNLNRSQIQIQNPYQSPNHMKPHLKKSR